MIYFADENSDKDVIEADICVIGAGAAGITIACEFIGSRTKVCVLESGGLELDSETQHLYDGEVIDEFSFPLESSRLRYFGGTTNHWGGLCRPLDEIDFEERDYIARSGWPIGLNDLAPFYERAQEYCELGPFTYDADTWRHDFHEPLELDSARVVSTGLFQQGPPTRFGDVYREDLRKASNVHVWLQANMIDFDLSEDLKTVQAVQAASLSGKSFRVRAHAFVLATGGVENARLLLNANGKKGLGNGHDIVGRFFMDHALIPVSGEVSANAPDRWRFYRKMGAPEVIYQGYFQPAFEVQRDEELLNCGLRVGSLNVEESTGIAALRRILGSLRQGSLPEDLFGEIREVFSDLDTVAERAYHRVAGSPPRILETNFWIETPPDPESRVRLIDEKDALGLQRVQLDWRLPSDFKRHYVRAHQLLGQELGRAGLGRLRMKYGGEDDDPLSAVRTAFHHIGTTRMHEDPRHGVVDSNCRAHGISNLFVAGSSVFPTSGHANPTLTIVALALRLADHLDARQPEGGT